LIVGVKALGPPGTTAFSLGAVAPEVSGVVLLVAGESFAAGAQALTTAMTASAAAPAARANRVTRSDFIAFFPLSPE